MSFSSSSFVVFFAVFYIVYFLTRWHTKARNFVILYASYVFYSWISFNILFLLLLSTVLNYYAALHIAASPSQSRRKTALVTATCANLAMIIYFKYSNFGIQIFNDFSALFGGRQFSMITVILPIGISFYTFQAISYLIDVYHRRIDPAPDLATFALYKAFFPQLVAGPIERAGHLMGQFLRPTIIGRQDVVLGITWILGGFFRKVVVADTMAPIADFAFSHPTPDLASGTTVVVGILAFGLQIYGDFSGYSYIARGCARLMGFDLMSNFDRPYFAASPREFWRRWHVSLSTWLRDYLYIPLGGSRCGPVKTARNVILTMGLAGLWHGANWHFVAWGLFHAGLMTIERLTLPAARFLPQAVRLGGGWLFTIVAVSVGWFIFRVDGLDAAAQIVSHVFAYPVWESQTGDLLSLYLTLMAVTLAHDTFVEIHGDDERAVLSLSWPGLAFLWASFGVAVLVVGFRPVPFIYFQF
ncbi:MAG: MBOAT family protein [Alphaproteobacteria bacterium]|nr:MBOAT family protein [Alphaproteobacteria bacterium]